MTTSFQLQLTEEQLAKAQANAAANGLTLSTAGGTLPEHSGVRMHYTGTQFGNGVYTFTVYIDSKPFYVPVSAVVDAVRKMLGL